MLHQPIIPAATSAPRRVTVMQGQAQVSNEPLVELTTVLGSCVACCLFDPHCMVGGMNHFLLAEPQGSRARGQLDEHYGVYLMEVLINDMMARGASKLTMKAHLYGGANLHAGMTKIGTANAAFAVEFLVQERIMLVHQDLGGTHARRVDFLPARGKARCRAVADTMAPVARPAPRPSHDIGDVELF